MDAVHALLWLVYVIADIIIEDSYLFVLGIPVPGEAISENRAFFRLLRPNILKLASFSDIFDVLPRILSMKDSRIGLIIFSSIF